MSEAQDTILCYCLDFITLYDPTTPKDIPESFRVALNCLQGLIGRELDTLPCSFCVTLTHIKS